jgi:hypothetical protein
VEPLPNGPFWLIFSSFHYDDDEVELLMEISKEYSKAVSTTLDEKKQWCTDCMWPSCLSFNWCCCAGFIVKGKFMFTSNEQKWAQIRFQLIQLKFLWNFKEGFVKKMFFLELTYLLKNNPLSQNLSHFEFKILNSFITT